MKKTILFLLAFVAINAQAQSINIPDPNFKAYLLGNLAINLNGDANIQQSEAAAFSGGILVDGMNISDMTGLEEFTSLSILSCAQNSLQTLDISGLTNLNWLACENNQLDSLYLGPRSTPLLVSCQNNNLSTLNMVNSNVVCLICSNNNLNNLDLSNLTALHTLECQDNNLTTLDVSNNSDLELLRCDHNQLTSINLGTINKLTDVACGHNYLSTLDLSYSTDLEKLFLPYNMFSSLDLSAFPDLRIFNGSFNLLTDLNIANGNNQLITLFRATVNPDLDCIQVDDVAFCSSNWTNIDIASSFSLDCSGAVGLELDNQTEINLYPNPASSHIKLNSSLEIEEIHILDMFGSIVYRGSDVNINIEGLARGVYLLKVKTSEGISPFRLVKE